MKKFLILSVGPVPTSKKSIVEGGGLRAWGIAKGLATHDIDVTVAVPEDFPIKKETTKEGIHVLNWGFSNLEDLCDKSDSVYILYSRGDLMKFVATKISLHKPLVIDLYVPIYIESLARNTKKDFIGLRDHLNNIEHWNYAFPRGDYFIYANEAQKHLYTGALGVFGRINPITYDGNLLEILPFGIHKEKPVHNKDVCKGKIISKKDFMILWFGGIYPWFDINPLLDAMGKLSKKHNNLKLVVVGGKNPFVTEPEFIKKYEDVVTYSKKAEIYEKSVFFVDWIPYEERENWYLEADLLINLHNPGTESIYAWRTRVVDFIWGELPMLTSGGDELTESLAQNNAAIILNENSIAEIYNKIEELCENNEKLQSLKENMIKIKSDLYWEKITANLANFIKKDEIAPDRKLLLKNKFRGQIIKDEKQSKLPNRLSYGLYVLRNEGLKPFVIKLVAFVKNRL
jgi:hypothetical protein